MNKAFLQHTCQSSPKEHLAPVRLWTVSVGSIRAHQEINKISRGTKVYAKQIHHLRAELAHTGPTLQLMVPIKAPEIAVRLAALNCTPLLHFEDAPFPGFFVADTKGINILSDDPRDYQQFGAHGDNAIEALSLQYKKGPR